MTVEMFVAKVGMDDSGKALVVLADEPEQRLLPIWIGPWEAESIARKLRGEAPPRPFTHDLLITTISSLGYELTDITVTRIENGVFFAELTLQGPEGDILIDSRPSDALALALRTGARIWVEEDVLIQAQMLSDEAEQWEEDKLRELLNGIAIEPEERDDDADAPGGQDTEE